MPVLLQTVLIGIFFRESYCYNNFGQYLFLTEKKNSKKSMQCVGFKKKFPFQIIFIIKLVEFFLAIESQDLLNKSKENIRFVRS